MDDQVGVTGGTWRPEGALQELRFKEPIQDLHLATHRSRFLAQEVWDGLPRLAPGTAREAQLVVVPFAFKGDPSLYEHARVEAVLPPRRLTGNELRLILIGGRNREERGTFFLLGTGALCRRFAS